MMNRWFLYDLTVFIVYKTYLILFKIGIIKTKL